MDNINKLARFFLKFPGIGERQAKRFVYFLLNSDPKYTSELIDGIKELKNKVSQCPVCFRFFPKDNNEICDICSASSTDKSVLLVIEKDSDYESVRKSAVYAGNYFILGGLVPITDKSAEEKTRIKQLFERVKKEAGKGTLKEIILAFSLNPHGNHTDTYVRSFLSPLQEKFGLKISSLGRGLSTGTEIEYSDDDTLKNALKNRQ